MILTVLIQPPQKYRLWQEDEYAIPNREALLYSAKAPGLSPLSTHHIVGCLTRISFLCLRCQTAPPCRPCLSIYISRAPKWLRLSCGTTVEAAVQLVASFKRRPQVQFSTNSPVSPTAYADL